MRVICGQLQAAWQVLGLEVAFEQRQPTTQAQRIMSGKDQVLALSFEMQLGEVRGISSLLAPCAEPDCARWPPNWVQLRRTGRRVKLEKNWYCPGECLERALATMLLALKTSYPARQPPRHRLPLGLLLVSRGELDFDQLRQALRAQREAAHGRLGDWLQELGFLSEDKITAALSVQWACPTLKITSDSHAACSGLVPYTLQEAYSMLPLHFSGQNHLLYMGFADRIAHRLLYAVDRMLSCRTIPCLLSRSAFKEAIQKLPPAPEGGGNLIRQRCRSRRNGPHHLRIRSSLWRRRGTGQFL